VSGQVDERRRAEPELRGERGVSVLFIGGLGRSGSTLLDRLLGQVPALASAGELRDLWQRGVTENRLCGCGSPFLECPFWTDVGQRGFGGWDRVDAREVISLAHAVDRHSRLLLLLHPRLSPSFARRLQRYADILGRLYSAVGEAAGGRIVIDSSKAPSTAFTLLHVEEIDLRAIHLLRDSRGVAYSWGKKVIRPDTPGREVYMHRYDPVRIGLRWDTRNLMMERLPRRGVPTARLRYEALVAHPREELRRVLRELDIPFAEEDLGFVHDGVADLGPSHTVMGNPMRMETGPVRLRLDDAWRTQMARRSSGMVTLLTRPFLRHYGYEP
jgi:hypothetical protein